MSNKNAEVPKIVEEKINLQMVKTIRKALDFAFKGGAFTEEQEVVALGALYSTLLFEKNMLNDIEKSKE